MPDMEEFSKADFIFSPKVELTAGDLELTPGVSSRHTLKLSRAYNNPGKAKALTSALYNDADSVCTYPEDGPLSFAAYLTQTDAGVVLGEAAQPPLQTVPSSIDTPDGVDQEDACIYPVSVLFAHATPLEPSSGLFADLVLAGDGDGDTV
ncbi:hypothetical protein CYMTET_7329 [Cymbomonas tetramitiformis]|uniref:Uncharacterized protein n=1 Tax=Cymbomonas tetramitiformis TaxID=36881 RepID=A0AAE0GV75_9CHLO|nr:hypothetical protein CYMTET_7329 [Cymbomonas tetramitiformis]